MSAYEYWTPLERLLDERNTPEDLITGGWAREENRDALVALFTEHDGVYGYDDDEDRCKCGKWIEWDHYEWPDHMSSVLEDSGLLSSDYCTHCGDLDPDRSCGRGKKPVEPATLIPDAFQFPRREITMRWETP